MKCLGIIPARGGSKGIPHKNIVDLGGKPLIAWTIESAKNSAVFDRLIVSTDDEEIAAISRLYGAEVPFLRPAEISRDDTSSLAVVLHTLAYCDALGWQPDTVVLLQPTSPFRSAQDIQASVALLDTSGNDSVVSVVEVEHSPYLSFTITQDKQLTPMFSEFPPVRRQDYGRCVRPNGAIYAVRAARLRQGLDWYSGRVLSYEMPDDRSLDIDTPWQLSLARLVAAAQKW